MNVLESLLAWDPCVSYVSIGQCSCGADSWLGCAFLWNYSDRNWPQKWHSNGDPRWPPLRLSRAKQRLPQNGISDAFGEFWEASISNLPCPTSLVDLMYLVLNFGIPEMCSCVSLLYSGRRAFIPACPWVRVHEWQLASSEWKKEKHSPHFYAENYRRWGGRS